MNRSLDGSYFRVKRNGKWQNICFSDLNSEERLEVLKDKDVVFLQRLCLILADTIKEMGERYDLKGD